MTRFPDAVQLTRKLLAFNTINPPGAEQACAQYLGSLLDGAGFHVEYAAFAASRTSVVARIGREGRPDAKAPLGFTGHMDTVPLGAAPWRADAFGQSLEGGRLYGRGATDMKSGVAGFVVAAIALAERLKDSPGVTLILTADEEAGCGGSSFLAHKTNLLGRVGALLVGEPTANDPLVGHKGALWLDATTKGVTAHGSMPERGVNAIHKAARAVTLLEDFDFGVAAHPLMGKPTLNVGTIRGGMNINSVPDRATIGIDIRTIPGQEHAAIRRDLQQLLGDGVEITPSIDVGAIYSEPTSTWMRNVFSIAGQHLGDLPSPRTATYFTDAAVLKSVYRDVPICILGPGEPSLAHQTDEYCLIDRIEQSVAIYSDLIREWNL